jgi:hypothetical protein
MQVHAYDCSGAQIWLRSASLSTTEAAGRAAVHCIDADATTACATENGGDSDPTLEVGSVLWCPRIVVLSL